MSLERTLTDAIEEYYKKLKEPASVNVRVDYWKYRESDPVKVTYNLAVVAYDLWTRDFDSLSELLFFIQQPISDEED